MKSTLSGFPELLPQERVVETFVQDTLRSTFELHGFSGIETRAVEPLSALESKGETSKQIYMLERLQGIRDREQRGEQSGGVGPNDLGLHFDLTVPLARYVLENANDLHFPLRRYQIQKVWRGERPQDGRFREFCQADIDVVGSQHLAFHHEVEVARVMLDALSKLPIPPVLMEVNNRRLLQGLLQEVGVQDFDAVLQALDKLDKVGQEQVAQQLSGDGLTDSQVEKVLRIAGITAKSGASLRAQVEALGLESDLISKGLDELCALLDGANEVAPGQVEASLRIARGLDYYTGSVYETVIPGATGIGSICSGGRYDALAVRGGRTYPGVGLSIGVSRLVSWMLSQGFEASRPTPSVVFVAVLSEDQRDKSDAIATQLRARGIPTEVSPKAARLGQQLANAEKRGVPYVWIPGDGQAHVVKDMAAGTQETVEDVASWQVPGKDLPVRVYRRD